MKYLGTISNSLDLTTKNYIDNKTTNIVTTNTAQTITGAKTFSGTFIYSGMSNGTSNGARCVWFSHINNVGQPVKSENFKYNPNTNDLTVGKINGFTLEANVPNTAVFTDTTNTAGSTDISSKIFLVGASTQAASAQTYSDDEVYATNGVLTSKAFSIGTNALMQYNSTDKCIEFIFS